jgi:predicted phage tail protein
MTTKQTFGRASRALAAALVVAAIAAPAAVANHEDVGARLALELRQQSHATAVRPDDRAVGPRSNPQVTDDSDALTRYLRNHLGLSGPGVQPVHRAASVHGTTASDGFDWGDAAVGAGFGCALLATLGGSLVLVRHTRRRTASA